MQKVTIMKSALGNVIPNQYIIHDFRLKRGLAGIAFQSYDSIIAMITKSGQVYLDRYYWDYSVTTGKYRNMFLRETKRETLRKIKSGVYKLINLNE